jgi:hypothetical protein
MISNLNAFKSVVNKYFGWVYTDITSSMLYDVIANALALNYTYTKQYVITLTSQPKSFQYLNKHKENTLTI